MPRYAIKIQYDGSLYVGYQVQTNGPSVQAAIEESLRLMAKLPSDQRIDTVASSRTDSGVHALGQVLHFDYPAPIHPQNLLKAMNSLLDPSIRVIDANQVAEDFHARYDVIGKHYLYRIDLSDYPDPFKRLYTCHHPYRFSLERINQALKILEGKHDFTSFCSTKSDKEDKVRELYHLWAEEIPSHNELHFHFYGKGFLYNMVRIIVGTSLQIGDGLKEVEEMDRLLEVKDRRLAGPTAPAQGLYLAQIDYPQDPFKN